MSTQGPHQEKIAVSLYYDGHNTPNITAKGRGDLADRILALAEKHGVPLREDPGLAAALSQIPLGEEIPETLYIAVAEVLAFAYYLSGYTPADIRARRAESARQDPQA